MDSMLPACFAAMDQAALSALLRDLLAYVPVGLLMAVAIVEMVAAGRRSRELESGVLVVLGVAALMVVGTALLAFVGGERGAPKLNGVLALLLALLCGAAALLRQQWVCQKAAEQLKATRRKGRSGASQACAFLYSLALLSGLGGLVAHRVAFENKAATTVAKSSDKLATPKPEEPVASADEAKPLEPEDPAPVVAKMDEPEPKEEPAEPIAETPPTEPAQPAPEPEPAKVAVAPEPAKSEAEPAKATVTSEPKPTAPAQPSAAANAAFASYIVPIFRQSCYSCHGPSKQKGGLRLDTPEFIRKGGKSGPCVEPGNPDKSHLYISVTLPDGDADLMPAEGKRLTKQQADLIFQWIKAGAPMGDGKAIAPTASSGAIAATTLPIDATVAKALLDAHWRLRPVAGKPKMIEADGSQLRNFGTKVDLAMLLPVAEQVDTLDLSRAKLDDADLAPVARMTGLTALKLDRVSVGDEALAHLAGLRELQTLNLYGTQVTDAGLEHLTKLSKLKRLYLFNSKATKEGADTLKKSLPKLAISLGE